MSNQPDKSALDWCYVALAACRDFCASVEKQATNQDEQRQVVLTIIAEVRQGCLVLEQDLAEFAGQELDTITSFRLLAVAYRLQVLVNFPTVLRNSKNPLEPA